MPNAKISIIGSGAVGLATAQRIASKDIADVVLVDVGDPFLFFQEKYGKK